MQEKLSKLRIVWRKHDGENEKHSSKIALGRANCHARPDRFFTKLNPMNMMKNPVMFVVEIGSVITSVLLVENLWTHGSPWVFDLQITLWLWFTVLFANFAEAMAEGRGKAQADALRRAKSETIANLLNAKGAIEQVPSSKFCSGNIVIVSAGRNDPRGRRNHRRSGIGR